MSFFYFPQDNSRFFNKIVNIDIFKFLYKYTIFPILSWLSQASFCQKLRKHFFSTTIIKMLIIITITTIVIANFSFYFSMTRSFGICVSSISSFDIYFGHSLQGIFGGLFCKSSLFIEPAVNTCKDAKTFVSLSEGSFSI